jgi:hypothetical protein
MLTMPGKAVWISAETSVLSGVLGETDVEADVVLKAPVLAADGVAFCVVDLPARAPPIVPPAIVTTANAAKANRRDVLRPSTTGGEGVSRTVEVDPAGAGQPWLSGATLVSSELSMTDLAFLREHVDLDEIRLMAS